MGESKYAYFLHDRGLFRLNVSDFARAYNHNKLKLECVFYGESNFPFTDMGLFSHHHNLYMIGGDSTETGRYPDGSSFYTFDPSKFKEFPVKDPECLHEPDFDGDFRPVKSPRVVRAKRMIYFLPNTVGLGHFYFQSFDPAENRFYTLPPPPIVVDKRNRYSLVSGDFVLRGYIYLFVHESCFRAFSFNTRLLKWREEESMVLQFKEKDIPLPYDHRGDIGFSDEFSDSTHVLVALSGRMPTAYRVCLHPRGSLSPKSYRHLREIYIENDDDGENCNVAQLLDLGGGKFCLIDYIPTASLLVCVFKIDFALEHENQISSVNKVSYESSEILSSKKFQVDDMPVITETWFADVCLASAPALQSYFPSAPGNEKLSALEEGFGSQEHEVTASPSNEDQERDGEIEKRNKISYCKRERGGNNARGPEDMGVEEEYEQIEGSVGEKQARSLSSLVSRQSGKKGKAIREPSTKQEESQEHDPVALVRSLVASHFEMNGLDKKGDKALSRWFIRSQLKAIMYSLAVIDRVDATSEQRIIQEAEYAAAEAKVKVLELQLEASNKANSAAQARLEALEQEEIKLRETVKAQRKQLKAKDEELASTQDKAIQEWRQSEEFRQAAQSYARENMDAVLSGFLSDKVAQKQFFEALFKTEAGKYQLRREGASAYQRGMKRMQENIYSKIKNVYPEFDIANWDLPKPLGPLPPTADEEEEGQAPGPSATEEGFGRQEHEVTAAPNSEDQDRDGQMEKRNKINSHKREMEGNNAKKRCCRSRD